MRIATFLLVLSALAGCSQTGGGATKWWRRRFLCGRGCTALKPLRRRCNCTADSELCRGWARSGDFDKHEGAIA